MQNPQRAALHARVLDAMAQLSQIDDFPQITSKYIDASASDQEVDPLRSFSQELQQQICKVFDRASSCTDKLKTCYVLAAQDRIATIHASWSAGLNKIFRQLNLLFPYTLESLHTQLVFNASLTEQLCKLGAYTATEQPIDLQNADVFGICEIRLDFASLLSKPTNGEALAHLYGLCVFLDKHFISPDKYRRLEPQNLQRTLRFLRIAGLSNAAFYRNENHCGAVETAKALGISLEQLVRCTAALERVFGAEESLIDLLINNCTKKLVVRYNHADIFLHLEVVKEVRLCVQRMVRGRRPYYSAFIDMLEEAMRPCHCFFLAEMCPFCPVCFVKNMFAAFRLNPSPERVPSLLKLVRALESKKKLFYCACFNDAKECIKSLQTMYRKKDFPRFLLSLQSAGPGDFLAKIGDECLNLLQNSSFQQGKLLPSSDAEIWQQIHVIYAASWIQLFNYQDQYQNSQNLSYFLQNYAETSILSHPSTDRFMVYNDQ